MEFDRPKVHLIGEPHINYDQLKEYFDGMEASKWYVENVEDEDMVTDVELLSEVYSRGCYKSFGTELNPNITKVREGNEDHLRNVIENKHGSVFSHGMLNFMLTDVSRVFTHELVRHAIGTAISQESLRYVRLTELKCFDFPRLASELSVEEETWFRDKCVEVFEYLEEVQEDMTMKFNLDNEKSFDRKKKLTSRMRRLAPLGLLTNIGWSCSLRALRYIIPLRTHPSAEEEIRYVFKEIGQMCKSRYENIFFDMELVEDKDESGLGHWRVKHEKI